MEIRAYLVNQKQNQDIVVCKDAQDKVSMRGRHAAKVLADIPVLLQSEGIQGAIMTLEENGYALQSMAGRRMQNASGPER